MLPPLSARLRFVRLCPGYAANSLGDLRRTSGQSNRVVSARDRLCPSLAAHRSQSKQCRWRARSAFVRHWPARGLAKLGWLPRLAAPTWPLVEGIVSVGCQDASRFSSRFYGLIKLQLGHFFVESGQVDHAVQLRLLPFCALSK